ncbi:hypothetical protein I3843_09G088800 [Carya illinoinensis]|nr:hypothetical protein I3760_09G087800 [Carya illinoinensis]KAG7962875.1 hypothetical protein I3843_09G088800 [Carya illinoinensis]
MKERASLKLSRNIILAEVFLLAVCFHECCCSQLDHLSDPVLMDKKGDAILPETSPSGSPRPFLPLLAPSPLVPFTNTTVTKLSGICLLNFTAAESLMNVTAIDCWSAFAPFLANVICCPQLEATLEILIGQSSKETNVLALNGTLAKSCLSDIEKVLVGQGANENLTQICSIHASKLTEASCPVNGVNELESIVDTSKLLAACEEIDPVKECCSQICQSAILEAATRIALKSSELLSMDGAHILPQELSSCNVNKVCPLVFPDIRHVVTGCGDRINNQTTCCGAMGSYVSHLQKQSFITNLQALDCAASLGTRLRKSNITKNVYSLCHINLKDFSLQVGNQEAGCLLPSTPSDATFDTSSEVSFLCDLNDNIPAPWPTTSQVPASCNKTFKIPALPAVASAQNGLHPDGVMHFLLFASSVVLVTLL